MCDLLKLLLLAFLYNIYKVQHPLKEIQIIFHVWQYIMTMLIMKSQKIRKKFNDIQSDHLKNVFKNSNTILAQNQPKNLLRLLSKARFNTDTNNFIQPKGLFKCTDKGCKICSLYVSEDNSLVISNNMSWKLCSRVTCRDINVIYYLICVTIKKLMLEKRLALMLLVLKAESISTLMIVEQVFPHVNFPYTYTIVP